jgi:chromosome segregation ATPase
MTDNDIILTDSEMIKAIECCTSTTEIGCELCPYSSTVNCLLRSTQDALDLINRYKAEIERLTDLINEIAEANEDLVRDNHDLYVSLKKRDAEIEELERQIENIEQEAELKWEREEMLDER